LTLVGTGAENREITPEYGAPAVATVSPVGVSG
jgi:hypothetical protein